MNARPPVITSSVMLALGLAAGCSSGSLEISRDGRFSDLSETDVRARSDGASARPVWLEGEILDYKNESWFVLGHAVVAEKSGAPGAIAAAEKRARIELSSAIGWRLESILDLLEKQAHDSKTRPAEIQRFRDRLSQDLPALARTKLHYWEQVSEKYRGFARLEFPQGAIKRVVLDTAKTLETRGEMGDALATAIRNHLDSLVRFDVDEVAPLVQMAPAGQN